MTQITQNRHGRVKPGHDRERQRSRHLVLKCNPVIPLQIGPKAWVLHRFRQNFDATPKRLADPTLKPDQPDQVHHGRWIELDGEIDIAFRIQIAPRDGAEQRQATNTGPA
jgi:hypothetical protein